MVDLIDDWTHVRVQRVVIDNHAGLCAARRKRAAEFDLDGVRVSVQPFALMAVSDVRKPVRRVESP
jgi:hypothetical protein